MPDLPFGFGHPGDSPGFLLWRSSTLWQRAVKEALRPFDLTHVQFVLLAGTAWLGSQETESTQVAIGDLAGSDPNTVSAAIKRIATKGLIERQVSASDARSRVVVLTDLGRAKLSDAAPAVERADRTFFSNQDNHDLLQELLRTSAQFSARE